jgi:hypothetical protein
VEGTISICLVDLPQAPQVLPKSVLADTLTDGFVLEIVDRDDQAATGTLEWSPYSFYLENGTIAPDSGVKFNQTVFAIGAIQGDGCTGGNLAPDTLYNSDTFCFAFNGQLGIVHALAIARDQAGNESDASLITFRTSDVILCDTRLDSGCFVEAVEGRPNATLTLFTLPSTLVGYDSLVYQFRLDTLPSFGILYALNDSDVFIELEQGDVIDPYTRTLAFQPDSYYYNRFHFPDYNLYSFNTSAGVSIGGCGAPIEVGCVDSFRYTAISTGGYESSTYGTITIAVDRVQNETLEACPLNLTYAATACESYGLLNDTYIAIFLLGLDGRLDADYRLQLVSLPTDGTLYHVIQGTDIITDAAQVGDYVERVVNVYPNLYYAPNPDYYNRIRYDVEPRRYFASVDQYGDNVILTCTDGTFNCTDGFEYRVVSGALESVFTTTELYRLYVAKLADEEQLTVCSEDSHGEFGMPCSSVGYETNDIDDPYLIPIFLTVNFTQDGETCEIRFLQLPENGLLYFNGGNETDLDYGDLVLLNSTMPCPTGENQSYPFLVYEGNDNYFNAIVDADGDALRYVDLNLDPFHTCYRGETYGCPDLIVFEAVTPDTGRRSNPGTYQIYVAGVNSDPEMFGLSFLYYIEGERFEFALAGEPFSYIDPDGDSTFVLYRIQVINSKVGFTGSMERLNFQNPMPCFNTTGCQGFITFYCTPSSFQPVLDTLFFEYGSPVDANGTDPADSDYAEDGEYILINIVKKYPYGVTPENAFLFNETDLDYEYVIEYMNGDNPPEEVDNDPDQNTTEVEGVPPPADPNDPEVVAQRKTLEVQLYYSLTIILGGLCALLLFGAISIGCVRVYCRRPTSAIPLAEAVDTGPPPPTPVLEEIPDSKQLDLEAGETQPLLPTATSAGPSQLIRRARVAPAESQQQQQHLISKPFRHFRILPNGKV